MWQFGNSEVLAILWIDNVPVTMLTTVHNIYNSKSHVTTDRKYPQDTSSNAAGIQQLYEPNEFIKLFSIPICIDNYNQFMSGIDIADQYRSYYTTQLIAQCNWLPIFFWLLDTALLNSFIIYREFFNSRVKDSCPFSHKEFNIEVAWSWILQGENDKEDKGLIISTGAEKNIYVNDWTSLPSAKSQSESERVLFFGAGGKQKNSTKQGNSNNFPRSSFICSSCNVVLYFSTEKVIALQHFIQYNNLITLEYDL